MKKDISLKNKHNIVDGIRRNKMIKGVNISYKGLIHFSLITYVLLAMFPFIFALFTSFKDPSEILTSHGLNFLPEHYTTENYERILQGDTTPIGSWIFNSVLYSLANTTINCVFNFMLGFALSRIAFLGNKTITWYFMAALLVPAQLTQYPQFFILLKMGVLQLDSYGIWMFGILFASFVNLYNSLMVRQYFMSINGSVEEAGVIDGLTHNGTFWRISMRMAIPLIATQWTLVFLWSWNNFIMFKLFALNQPELKNLASGLADMASSHMDRWKTGKLLAGSIISFIPVLAIYIGSLFFQKRVQISGEK